MTEITKEQVERDVHRLRLAIAEIAALTLTEEDVLDDIFRICKHSTFEYMVEEAYVALLKKKVKTKLREVKNEL